MGNGEYMHAPQMGQTMAQPVEWLSSSLVKGNHTSDPTPPICKCPESRLISKYPNQRGENSPEESNKPTKAIAVKSDSRAATIPNGLYMHCLYGCIPRIHVYILYMCISICIYSFSFSKVIPSSLKARTLLTFISLAFTIYLKFIFSQN